MGVHASVWFEGKLVHTRDREMMWSWVALRFCVWPHSGMCASASTVCMHHPIQAPRRPQRRTVAQTHFTGRKTEASGWLVHTRSQWYLLPPHFRLNR